MVVPGEMERAFLPSPIRRAGSFAKYQEERQMLQYRIWRHVARCVNWLGMDEPLAVLYNRMQEMRPIPRGRPTSGEVMLEGIKSIRAIVSEQKLSDMALAPRHGSAEEFDYFYRLYGEVAKALDFEDSDLILDFVDEKWWYDALSSRSELQKFEYKLLNWIFQLIVQHSQEAARMKLEEKYEMLPREAQEMVATARHTMTQAIDLDQETERKIQSIRLENLAQQAREDMDNRLELAAYKERSRLLGLTDRPPESAMEEILGVIQESSEDDMYLPESSPEALE